jgi:hypothetical protein
LKPRQKFVLIQINHQSDATIIQFIILTFIYSSTGFGRFPAHHQEFKLNDCSGSLWFYLRIVVIVVLLFMVGPMTNTLCAVNLLTKYIKTSLYERRMDFSLPFRAIKKTSPTKMWSRGYPRDLFSSFLSSRPPPKNGDKCLTRKLTNFVIFFIKRPTTTVFKYMR